MSRGKRLKWERVGGRIVELGKRWEQSSHPAASPPWFHNSGKWVNRGEMSPPSDSLKTAQTGKNWRSCWRHRLCVCLEVPSQNKSKLLFHETGSSGQTGHCFSRSVDSGRPTDRTKKQHPSYNRNWPCILWASKKARNKNRRWSSSITSEKEKGLLQPEIARHFYSKQRADPQRSQASCHMNKIPCQRLERIQQILQGDVHQWYVIYMFYRRGKRGKWSYGHPQKRNPNKNGQKGFLTAVKEEITEQGNTYWKRNRTGTSSSSVPKNGWSMVLPLGGWTESGNSVSPPFDPPQMIEARELMLLTQFVGYHLEISGTSIRLWTWKKIRALKSSLSQYSKAFYCRVPNIWCASEASCLAKRIVVICFASLDEPAFHAPPHVGPCLAGFIPDFLLKSVYRWNKREDFIILIPRAWMIYHPIFPVTRKMNQISWFSHNTEKFYKWKFGGWWSWSTENHTVVHKSRY